MQFEDMLLQHGIGFSGSNIKSTQRGFLTMTTTESNIQINEVDTSKSIVIIECNVEANSYIDDVATLGELTSNNNLKLSRTRASFNNNVSWTVVELQNIKSIQIIKSAIGPGSPSFFQSVIPINPVDLSKSLVFFSRKLDVGGSTARLDTGFAYLSKNNEVTIKQHLGNGTTGEYQLYVVEF